MHSRLIDCLYSVFFAAVSLIAQHNHRHGLPILILSLSVIKVVISGKYKNLNKITKI